jgi:ribonuclease P protein component
MVAVAAGGPGSPRVGVVAGRAVGGAVARNRAKRRLREAISRAPIRADRDYVVTGRRVVLEVPFEDLVGWVVRAVQE